MRKKSSQYIVWGGVVLVVVVVSFFLLTRSSEPGKLDDFAKCLEEKEAFFYGAFWCPHCATQKKMFGRSQTLIPYIECSTPDQRGQTQICSEKGITGYPTWEFSDGTRQSGVVSLEELSEKTGCVLPQ